MKKDEVSPTNEEYNYDLLTKIIDHDSKQIHDRSKKEILKPRAILLLNGEPLIFPNTINVIEGQPGANKSRLAETICGAMLSKATLTNDNFIKNNGNQDVHCLYVDTERNFNEQAPRSLQHIKLCAGYKINDNIPGLEFWSLIRINRELRLATIKRKIRDYHDKNPGTMLFVVLDLISDCILDFNKVTEAFELIDVMLELNNTTDTVFLAVIHQNPGNNNTYNKARGHIGTELVNKSTTAIEINAVKSKDNSRVFNLNLKKTRNIKLGKGCFLKVNDETQMLEVDSTITQSQAESISSIQMIQEQLYSLYKDGPENAVPSKELESFISHLTSKSVRTSQNLIKDIVKFGHEITNPDNQEVFKLTKIKLLKSGNCVGYKLLPV